MWLQYQVTYWNNGDKLNTVGTYEWKEVPNKVCKDKERLCRYLTHFWNTEIKPLHDISYITWKEPVKYPPVYVLEEFLRVAKEQADFHLSEHDRLYDMLTNLRIEAEMKGHKKLKKSIKGE